MGIILRKISTQDIYSIITTKTQLYVKAVVLFSQERGQASWSLSWLS